MVCEHDSVLLYVYCLSCYEEYWMCQKYCRLLTDYMIYLFIFLLFIFLRMTGLNGPYMQE